MLNTYFTRHGHSREAVMGTIVFAAAWVAFAGIGTFHDEPRAGDARTIAGVPLRWCPPGTFLMGSPPTEVGHRPDEGPVEVTISRGFWTAEHEATEGDWKRVVGALPGGVAAEADDLPVQSVNFLEAEEFCRKLTELARRGGELPDGWEFRLPTEAQWEYACRAGTATATAFGDSLGRDRANFAGEPYNGGAGGAPRNHAAPVGRYPANAWGIRDMHGNTWEWCRDWYHFDLPGGTDPDLSITRGQRNRDGTYSHVRRGGAWVEDGWPCRSACRLRYEPERRSDHIGFRVVLVRP